MKADTTRAKRFARRGLLALRRVLRGTASRAYMRWRRSIQVRVVTSTLFISAIVVAILGVFLMQQVSTALMDGKVKAARLQLDEGLAQVQRDLGNSTSPAAEDGSRLNAVVNRLKARSGPSGLYEVYIRDTTAEYFDGYATNELRKESVPKRLRDELKHAPAGARAYTYGKLTYVGGHPSERGLIVGGKSGQFELYYLFPLEQEQKTLTNVSRSMVGVGVVLVLLLAAIASLVTRQVVIPVRLAAQGAQRLAAGRLEERMRVRGEDDLARQRAV